jgi:RNA polymerase sigma factor (sigma-70 family)
LPDANDAEDAFQATFLVLVRKGAKLREPDRLANWLYGVACRTARKIRVRSAVRSKHEREARPMQFSSDVDRLTLHELRTILDEEIGKLPEKYALPLTLCYLEGKTNAEAAAQLGWPEGSMSRRLSRARDLLRSRMARRGLALSAALIASVFAKPLLAAPPPSLLEATASAGCLLLRGAPLAEVVSYQAAFAVGEAITGFAWGGKLLATSCLAFGSVFLAVSVGVCQFASECPMGPLEAVQYFTSPAPVHDGVATICVPGTGVTTGVPTPGALPGALPPPLPRTK